MNPLKERITEPTTKTITTLFIGSALLISFMAMVSMQQMVGTAYATVEERGEQGRGAENACKDLPGAELERGECVTPATETRTVTCKTVFGQTPTPSGETCTATTTVANPAARSTAEATCREAGGSPSSRPVTGGPGFVVTCTYPATVTITFTCPNDITPTPGPNPQCITKPGDRT